MSYRGPDNEHRCTAHNAMGSRCYAYAIRGGKVCRYHGGLAPQVQAKAEDRIRALVDPSLNRIARAIADDANPQLALAAARDILDRAGYKATDKVQTDGRTVIEIEYVKRPLTPAQINENFLLNGH